MNKAQSLKRSVPTNDEFTSLGSGKLGANTLSSSLSSSYSCTVNKESEFSSLAPSSADDKNLARQFYNKQDKTQEERQQSSILHLRSLNNWIKFTLIHDYCKQRSRVLDLACGKGGDLKKWKEQHILHYVGVDIADGSIRDAVERYKSMLNPGFPARFVSSMLMMGRFAVANLGTCDLDSFLETVFPMVSIEC